MRKNLFLSICHCLDPKISLREMNDLYGSIHGGLVGYGDSYLDSVLRYSKVFHLHAILHDAAGAVYREKRKGPGFCYMIGCGSYSCLFGLITGLFCLFLKFFVASIFNRFNCWPNHFWTNTTISLTNEVWSPYLLLFINSLLSYVRGTIYGKEFLKMK